MTITTSRHAIPIIEICKMVIGDNCPDVVDVPVVVVVTDVDVTVVVVDEL